jgi:hypothetical protein
LPLIKPTVSRLLGLRRGTGGAGRANLHSSHEMCEAITAAIPGQGWYDDVHGEIGDIRAWQTKKVGAYTAQLEWSNKAKRSFECHHRALPTGEAEVATWFIPARI